MESAVAAARAAGPVPNGATAMEEDEPPSKRVRRSISQKIMISWSLFAEDAAFLAADCRTAI